MDGGHTGVLLTTPPAPQVTKGKGQLQNPSAFVMQCSLNAMRSHNLA